MVLEVRIGVHCIDSEIHKKLRRLSFGTGTVVHQMLISKLSGLCRKAIDRDFRVRWRCQCATTRSVKKLLCGYSY